MKVRKKRKRKRLQNIYLLTLRFLSGRTNKATSTWSKYKNYSLFNFGNKRDIFKSLKIDQPKFIRLLIMINYTLL